MKFVEARFIGGPIDGQRRALDGGVAPDGLSIVPPWWVDVYTPIPGGVKVYRYLRSASDSVGGGVFWRYMVRQTRVEVA